ncbi:MAG: hypothetical protein QOJ65_542 [Fimbriimonadaceae bacterium]|jgi:RimJ/RimL family protein N-acetyltransferase|nr:hypothetical protein [Fimbriimonadaceae bacterium]
MLDVQPIVLKGKTVRQEPLDARHAKDLARHAEPELFQWFAASHPTAQTESAVLECIERLQAIPDMVPFATVLQATGEAIGSTTYMDIRPKHMGLEIGTTWIGRAHQGTKVNPESKLLLLAHAFERLGCERVQLKTDGRNLQSQHAIEKLGAVKEGVLRKHMIMPDGFVRDTVMYSIVAAEWPDVKRGLEARLAG